MVKNLGEAVLWVEEIGSSTLVDPMSGQSINLLEMAVFERTAPAQPGSRVSYVFCEKDPEEFTHRTAPVCVFIPERNVAVHVYKALHRLEKPRMTHGQAVERRQAIGQTVNRYSW